MATSGVYDFDATTYQIIVGALRLLGAIESGETPPADEYDDALKALNGLVKSWQVNGLHVWTQTTMTITMVVGQAEYAIGLGSGGVEQVRPLRVSEARLFTISSQDVTPLIPMSRLDYANLSDVTVPTGTPANFFYDPQIPYGKLSVYPAPANLLSSLKIVAQRPLQDFVSQADDADLPIEWLSALRFALAVELAPEYDCAAERFTMVKTLADEKLKVVQAWDQEPQGTTTYPFSQSVYQLIAGALRLCGGSGGQDVPRFGQVQNAFYALNAMVQAWQATGIHVWAEQDCTLFLQEDQIRYEIGIGTADHATLSSDWVQTATTVDAAAAATALVVSSVSGAVVDGAVGVWLDSGLTFWTGVASVVGSTVTLDDALPSIATSGAQVVFYSADLPRPLRVPAARSYQFAAPGGQPIETPMAVMARLDYANVPNKTTPGTTTQFFYDPQSGQTPYSLGVLFVWPAPSDNQRALKFTAQRSLNTYSSLTAVQDFPAEWSAAIRWNLAVELWPEYVERRMTVGTKGDWDFASLATMALDKLTTAQNWDREPQSVYFGLENMPASRDG